MKKTAQSQTGRQSNKRLIIISLIGAIVVAVALIANQLLTKSKPTSPLVVSQPAIQPKPKITGLESKMLFMGNAFWGRYTHDKSMASPLKYQFPFARLQELEREKYQAWIAGLECPTVPNLKLTAAQQEATLSFNCPPEYLTEAKKWFTAFTLANNHTDNQGAEGFAETKRQLDQHQIQYFGHYEPYLEDEVCEILSIDVQYQLDNGTTKIGQLPMAFCALHGVFKIPPAQSIAQITPYAQLLPTFALPHMGAEYRPGPDQIKTSVYRHLVEAGADAVLGDHPHWIQNAEVYQNKLIVYSMGNFMFDQQFNQEVTRSAAIEVTLTTTDQAELEKWLEIGPQCAKFKDNCLELIRQAGLKKPQFKLSFGVVGTDNKGYQVHKATPAQEQAILQRLNWSAVMSKLKP